MHQSDADHQLTHLHDEQNHHHEDRNREHESEALNAASFIPVQLQQTAPLRSGSGESQQQPKKSDRAQQNAKPWQTGLKNIAIHRGISSRSLAASELIRIGTLSVLSLSLAEEIYSLSLAEEIYCPLPGRYI